MRGVGLLLVLLGLVALGYQGFTHAGSDPEVGSASVEPELENRVWGPPLVGGTAVVAGLVLLAPRRRGA